MKLKTYPTLALILLAVVVTALMWRRQPKPTPGPRPAFEGYLADSSRCGNNHYDLMVYQNYFVVMDGGRVVDTLPFGKNGQLDTVILKDNQ